MEEIKMAERIAQENLLDFTGITCDSRKVKPGYAFVAISGFKTDGNKFIDEAVRNGAKAIFTEKAPVKRQKYIDNIPLIQVKNAREYLAFLAAHHHDHPSKEINLIGITGTNGKTTTTHLIYHLLNYNVINNSRKKLAGLIGTINVDTGKNIFPGKLTTPDSITLQEYLREMVDNGLKYACMEVSSHGIKLRRIGNTRFTVKVGTNISADHFDLHPDLNDYIQVKKDFLKDNSNIPVLINQDNKYLGSFGQIAKNQINYSINNKSDVYADKIEKWGRGQSFLYHLNKNLISENEQITKPFVLKIMMNLPGEHNIYNALIAVTIALYYNISMDLIQGFFENFRGIWRRLEFVYDKEFTIIDDCAHNPGSYEAVFTSISRLNFNKVIVVNSLRGNRGTAINKKNADIIAKYIRKFNKHLLITTNCNEVVKEIDRVSLEEEATFIHTLYNNNLVFEHYQLLHPALQRALDIVEKNDIILLLGPHAMDRAAVMIMEMFKNIYMLE